MTPIAGFARFVVSYSIAVILWGTYVRATGPGAGCGSHWPLCNGEIVPTVARTQTLIEFTHRIGNALSLALGSILLICCWRRIAKGDWPRYSAVSAAMLLFNEAFLGAMLVIFDRRPRPVGKPCRLSVPAFWQDAAGCRAHSDRQMGHNRQSTLCCDQNSI